MFQDIEKYAEIFLRSLNPANFEVSSNPTYHLCAFSTPKFPYMSHQYYLFLQRLSSFPKHHHIYTSQLNDRLFILGSTPNSLFLSKRKLFSSNPISKFHLRLCFHCYLQTKSSLVCWIWASGHIFYLVFILRHLFHSIWQLCCQSYNGIIIP